MGTPTFGPKMSFTKLSRSSLFRCSRSLYQRSTTTETIHTKLYIRNLASKSDKNASTPKTESKETKSEPAFDFSTIFAKTDIPFPKNDSEYPDWLEEVVAPKPNLFEMSEKEDGARYRRLKKKLQMKENNAAGSFK